MVILWIPIILASWLLVSLPFYKMGYENSVSSHLNEERTKSNWNAIALFMNIREGEIKLPKFEKKTSIDKEIEAEEKEIEELEKQKEKINRLHRLKRRKEELFEQIEGSSK